MIVLIGLSKIPFRAFKVSSFISFHSKYKFLGLILPHLYRSTCRNCTTGFGSGTFDNVQVQKYLNFITNEGMQQMQQLRNITEIKALLQQKEDLEREIRNLKNWSPEADEELKELIKSEKKHFLDVIERIKNEILTYISLDKEEENRSVELQIFSGIGGEEAKLFRQELFQMYISFADYKNWECQVDPHGGFMLVSGVSVFGYLRHEAGVHRVQRVPETEKQNRIHTSTCSVIVLPQPKPHEVVIHEKDLIIEKMRSSGPGGQHVNKTESCIRIKHIPTDIVVESQTSRFQFENKKIAIERLKNILFNIEQDKIQKDRKNLIKGQAGTNDYADKIRTYNFQQNRITDHRINYSMHNIKGFLSGTKDLDFMINKLKKSQRENDLFSQIEKTLQSEEYKNFEKKQIS